MELNSHWRHVLWSEFVQCNSKFTGNSKFIILLQMIIIHELLQICKCDVKYTVIVVIIINIAIVLVLPWLSWLLPARHHKGLGFVSVLSICYLW
jgi:hypothetical protein